jgi:hypothetical protein
LRQGYHSDAYSPREVQEMERDTFDVEVRLEVEFVVSVTQPWRYDERVNMAKRR